jgi:hypothetical protein
VRDEQVRAGNDGEHEQTDYDSNDKHRGASFLMDLYSLTLIYSEGCIP